MKILLDKWSKLAEVQAEFNNAYPYLKLLVANNQRPSASTLGDLNATIKPFSIELNGQMAVNEVEKIMSEYMHVPVKVLRKSGNIWLETTHTNHWTLSQQNEHAREISSPKVF